MMIRRWLLSMVFMVISLLMTNAAMTTADSIQALMDLYDLTLAENPNRADSIAEIAYQRALAHGDTLAASAMLASRADINANNRDSLNMLLMRCERLANCPDVEQNSLFIRFILNSWYRNNALESERLRRFADEFRRYTLTPPENFNDKLVLLHSVCVNLPFYLNTKVLYDYCAQLRALVDRKPDDYYKLRVLLCRCEALSFYQVGDTKRGMDADMRLLTEMDSIESLMHRVGRHFFQLNYSRFLAYTRLLSNFEKLSPEQINEYYQLAHKFLEISARARREFQLAPMADIYFHLSNHDYAAAAPLLDTALKSQFNKTQRASLLRYRIECAKVLNQDEVIHSCTEQYIEILESMVQKNLSESDRGRRAVYDAFVARDDLNRFEAEKRSEQIHSQQIMGVMFIVTMALMFVILIIIWHQKIHQQRFAKQLRQANREMQYEIERQKRSITQLTTDCASAQASADVKDDFIRHLSEELTAPFTSIVEHSRLIVDCSDDENHKYLAEYQRMIESNGALVAALLEDMQRINALEDGSALPLHRPIDIRYLLSLVIDSISPSYPDIKVNTNLPPNNLQILSDPGRLQQILASVLQCLLQLASKAISISAFKADDTNIITIYYEAREPKLAGHNVFEGDTRVDGMLYTRMLTHLLGGKIAHDTTFNRGLRLILTFPYA